MPSVSSPPRDDVPVPDLGERASGILLHLTSLPGPHGSGDLGAEARRFVDFLARSGQRWWQMLPVGPAGYGDSPYSALSAFAGSPLFLSLEGTPPELPATDTVDYAAAIDLRERHLRASFADLTPEARSRRAVFLERESAWVEDFALFEALKRANGGRPWIHWEPGVRHRDPAALARARKELATDIDFAKTAQWVFDEQWTALRDYCRERGVGLIGDLPIFVAHDSADVWQHRTIFDLAEDGMPNHVAGVPPDYFSKTGQRWGNPLYRWDELARRNYDWWVDRFAATLRRFDVVRLDHFIGFVRFWQIPAAEKTAVNGQWVEGPGKELFAAVERKIGGLPLIAEDLGAVTPEVTKLRKKLGLPGMRLLQFAFGSDTQAEEFLPHNHRRNSAVYTGTHDNDTTVGWFTDPGGVAGSSRTREETDAERHRALTYMGRDHGEPVDPSLELMRLASMSPARTCIFPMQDVLGLGNEARMNRPGSAEGNWRWRLRASELDAKAEERLLGLAQTYGRAPKGNR